MTHFSRARMLAAAIIGASFGGSANAALGAHAGGIESDARALQARSFAARRVQGASWTRQDLALPDGGTATEFADASGTVFAVAWSAPTLPDLSVLLGAHSAGLARAQLRAIQARQSPQAGSVGILSHRMLSAQEGDLVVRSGGQLQAYRGHAFLSSGLPSDFDVKELGQ